MKRAPAVALGLAVLLAPPALAHQGNPNFLSQVDAITPATQGSPSTCSIATTACCSTTRAARTW